MACHRSAESAGSVVGSCGDCCIVEWYLQSEQRTLARAVAMGGQPAIHFNGCQGAAMQAEAMAFLARGETVGEDPRHVFGGDAFTFVFDADLQDAVLHSLDRQRN